MCGCVCVCVCACDLDVFPQLSLKGNSVLAWLSLRVPLISPCTAHHYSPNGKTHQSWSPWHRPTPMDFGFRRLRPSPQPVCRLFVTQPLFFWDFLQQFPIHFLKGKVPPGCNLGPKPHLVPTDCECLTILYWRKINMPISGELNSHTSHHGQ